MASLYGNVGMVSLSEPQERVERQWHAMSAAEVLSAVGSRLHGLDAGDAEDRLKSVGPNALREPAGVSRLLLFAAEFRNPLIIVLIGAAALLLTVGVLSEGSDQYIDGGLILAIVVVNAGLSFAQNYRANVGIEALRRMEAPMASVVRGGQTLEIPARDVVPGDVVHLEEGDRVPADGRLLNVVRLQVDEAPLTGESLAVVKQVEAVPVRTSLAERRNSVYAGTVALSGRGAFVVTHTAMETEMGRIAGAVQAVHEGPTAFQREIGQLGRRITIIVGVLIAVIVVVELTFVAQTLLETFVIAVALAVAAIPEGLPVVLTLALAFGTRRMLERHALVRSLPVVQIIGSARTVCTDKTGTLTEGRMSLRFIDTANRSLEVTGEAMGTVGEFLESGKPADQRESALLVAAGLCNNAHRNPDDTFSGDPTEVALLVGALKGGVNLEEWDRLHEVPFSSERRLMSVVVEREGERRLLAKGAAEVVIASSVAVATDTGVIPLDETARREWLARAHSWASQGDRVLALAERRGSLDEGNHDVEEGLTLLGLAAIADPPRSGARDAVATCHSAGIRVVMITGDALATARAIAREVGMPSADGEIEAMEGRDLDELNDQILAETVARVSVFARAEPRHKVRILSALQGPDHVVVMTGDGVNDAPALKASDVGIAMGLRGTDVARSASDMVLLDDSFPTIVAAVEEGRRIFANIRKFVSYLLIGNLAEVVVILGGAMAGYLPVTAVQILWINLVTDSGPAVALSVDPASPGIMRGATRGGPVIGRGTLALVGAGGAVTSSVVMASFFVSLVLFDLKTAQTVTFTAFVVQEYIRLAVIRFQEGTSLLTNRWLVGAVLFSLALQVSIIYSPAGELFGTERLGPLAWAVLGTGLVVGFLASLVVARTVVRRFGDV